jgi:pyrophosphate--fructose-6-phosphate 1-phosphotransferase
VNVARSQIDDIQRFLDKPEVQKFTSAHSDNKKARIAFKPPICPVFESDQVQLEELDAFRFEIDNEAQHQLPGIIENKVQAIVPQGTDEGGGAANYARPRRIGIVFSGGPAPGGHNVIAGLFDAAKKANAKNRIFGFLVGPDGIIEGEYIELDDELVNRYRNLGGFTMIKTGRTKIDTPQKMELSKETILGLKLDALVVVGGDDSNTNAAFLAQELLEDGVQVIGVPKTIDGDIQVRDADGNVLCAMSFGFHSAARAFAQAISNLSNDCSSDIKYWHIC